MLNNKKRFLWTILGITISVFLLLFLKIVIVSGTSMKDTLANGDILICFKNDNIYQGNIVAFKKNGKYLIKRVVAIPEQEVDFDIKEGIIYIDSQVYFKSEELIDCEVEVSLPVKLQKNQFFVLGDNINNSIDSRNNIIGVVNKNEIIGVCYIRIYPRLTLKLE